MKYSILHISDIHKGQGVEYDSLFESLRRDLECYTNRENILSPSFVVVSGDIIQGAYSSDLIKKQYDDVALFLSNICDLFLNGNKKRLVIVPGNHDVDRVVSIDSMQPTGRDHDFCTTAFFSGSATLRWNWKDKKFYEIVDCVKYGTRFSQFIEFYNAFYQGIRKYPDDPEKKADLVVDYEYEISFSLFNSCHNLDHLRDTGGITEEAVTSISKGLTDCYNSGYLNVGVWHHHFYGMPIETNYMDRSFLNNLLSCNIQMGLYGHQHYTQVAEEYSDLLLQIDEETQKLLLISSGTLFGGEKTLAPNCKRQYNIIEVEKDNGYATISINIREDFNPNLNNKIPHWHLKPLPSQTNKLIYVIKLKKLSLKDIILSIDRKSKVDGDFIAACEAIKQLQKKTGQDLSRFFRLYLKEVKDYEYVFKNIHEVKSIEDAILKIVAAKEIGNPKYIREVISDSNISGFDDSNLQHLLAELKKDII